jgi:signal transduction histidine kinase
MAGQIDRQLADLEEQDAQRRKLLANISHDVRTPLTHLQGYLETLLIRGEALAPDERSEYLQIAARRAEQLGRLVSDLFELGKLSAPAETLDKEAFSIAELVQDVAQGFKLVAAGRDIVLDVQTGEAPALVDANLNTIERVLQNLIENAFRHARSGDHIAVTAAERQGVVSISVKDSGPGIAAHELPRIFDRFYHREPGAGSGDTGSGLGLAIAKRGLELHGSELRCESEVGVGTTFSFELDLS